MFSAVPAGVSHLMVILELDLNLKIAPKVHFLWFKCSLNCSINFALEKERALCEPAVALCL